MNKINVMKTRLFFIVLLMYGLMPTVAQPVVHVNTRDTVRYGDPWYTFKPMPTLTEVWHDYDGYSILFTNQVDQVYTSDKSVLYGIAVTIDSIPKEESSAWLKCWRGVYYHLAPLPYDIDRICFDSVLYSDSISTWNPPLVKQCVFEYQIGESGNGFYKSTFPANCFEFYFDEPLSLIPQDTFLIGGYANITSQAHRVRIIDYCGIDGSASQSWMQIGHIPPFGICHIGDTFGYFYDHNTNYVGSDYDYYCNYNRSYCHIWGMVFPITELRCTKPRGLEVDSASRMVRWDHDADGVLFQLSLCAEGTLPDNGYIVTTADTMISFAAMPSLSPDTVYRLYLRKQCDFSTSRAATVWSDWCEPVVLNRNAGHGTEGISDVEANGLRIHAEEGRIVVEGAEGMEVKVYDVKGIQVANHDLPAGVYMVHIGNFQAKKVVIVK